MISKEIIDKCYAENQGKIEYARKIEIEVLAEVVRRFAVASDILLMKGIPLTNEQFTTILNAIGDNDAQAHEAQGTGPKEGESTIFYE